ncbi:MAG: molybdopterin molybdotransferase MoeA [Marinosulfonomonas sp.]
MITVAEALARTFALTAPMEIETVPLWQAHTRVLAKPVTARRDQPPFASSAMDGYALIGAEAAPGATFTVIGESAAGSRFDGAVSSGQAVRIFTGAPIPPGADRVIIQEDVEPTGNQITLRDNLDSGPYIRDAGIDFRNGATVDAPHRLTPNDIALLAAMNIPSVPVYKRPVVALVSTGNELVMPGETPGEDQIIASNSLGLAAMAQSAGADPRILPIARDTIESVQAVFDLAQDADLIVTNGGASVGDYDIIGRVAQDVGLDRSFYSVAMRPGKPLMAGRLGQSALLGLPGNPVSSMVCGHVFMLPMIRAMLGLGAFPAPRFQATLSKGIGPNGKREHYMRARLDLGTITPADRQDSALLSVLAQANALMVRPVNGPARKAGDTVDYIPL